MPTQPEAIHPKPLRGTGLVVSSPSRVFIAVDNLFGGDGASRPSGRSRVYPYRTAHHLPDVQPALEGYSDAWKAINPLEVSTCVRKGRWNLPNHHLADDIVVNTLFHVEIGNLTANSYLPAIQHDSAATGIVG
ncbi:hypothetical protein ACLK1T_24560 [Escherichia coli]